MGALVFTCSVAIFSCKFRADVHLCLLRERFQNANLMPSLSSFHTSQLLSLQGFPFLLHLKLLGILSTNFPVPLGRDPVKEVGRHLGLHPSLCLRGQVLSDPIFGELSVSLKLGCHARQTSKEAIRLLTRYRHIVSV